MNAELSHEIPPPEHVLEELVHAGPPRRVVAGNRAELCSAASGTNPEQNIPILW